MIPAPGDSCAGIFTDWIVEDVHGARVSLRSTGTLGFDDRAEVDVQDLRWSEERGAWYRRDTRNICHCDREPEPGEDHSGCWPGMLEW